MNIQKLREVLKTFRPQNVVAAYPASLDDDGEIIVSTDLQFQQILAVGAWMGEVAIFYEEKPMFVAILMSDETLCKTTICNTKEYAIIVAIQYVKEYSTLVDLRATAREYLTIDGAFSFAEGGFGYTVHIGRAND